MKFQTTLTLALAVGWLAAAPKAWTQVSLPSRPPAIGSPTEQGSLADAYFYFAEGHLEELQYELTSDAQSATQAIESYKKALAIDPNSGVVKERLAEIYAKSQHIRDAVIEAQEALQIDPTNVDAHRLLARIYVRSLGDLEAGDVQQENLTKAIEQFQAILKLDPRDTYSSLWLARLYRFENKHDDAEQVLRGVIKQEPDNEPALEQLSQLLIDEGRSQEVIDLLTQAARDAASPDLYDLLGEAYSQLKSYANAEAAYRKAVDEDPDDPGHRHGLAQALMAEEKYAAALEQFQKLSQLEPGNWENPLRASQLQRHLGQFDDAASSLARARQLAPGNLEVLYNEALLDQDQGRFDDAVKILTDAIAGMKNEPGTNANALSILYELLGHVYRDQGNYQAALDAFQEMAKANPDAAKHAQMLAIDTYRESHDLDRAIAEAKKALSQDPKSEEATVTLALLYGEKSETSEGMQLLEGLLKGTDADQEIYLDIAQVQVRGKKFSEAEQAALKALQMAQDPKERETAWFMLGSIYERQKRYDQAEQQFRKVLEVNPNNAPVLNYLGYMLADRGIRIEEATSMIQHALKEEPSNGAYLDSLGWAYYKQNKFTEAEQYLRKAVEREGRDPTILSHLADVYLKLGQNERAADLFERSLAEWQRVLPADYEADKANEVEAQLKNLKRRLAQKSSPETAKPQ
ncbi:MAG TPA: tetratricopeptide repeat protein [Candidatus Acidoferrales bacterium]|nr:tetratricopeptide repeat protein [Candidatus Acidoferrales bacterium]